MRSVSKSKLTLLIPIIFLLNLAISALAETIGTPNDNPVAATVNGKAIYLTDLKESTDKALTKFKKSGSGLVTDETRKWLQKKELEQTIDFELLVQAGEKVVGTEIEKMVDEKIGATTAIKADSKLPKKATAMKPNNTKHRQQIKRNIYAEEYLVKRGIREIKPTESESKAYYEQNKLNFREPESVKVSHILIKLSKNAKSEEIAQSKKEIERLREKIVNGKSFADVAKQHSSCASAKDGGDLGYISRGYMPNEFDQVAFSLKQDQISEVVKTRHGFHLIKVSDKKPGRVQEYSEVKDIIGRFLQKQIQASKTNELIAELRRTAQIEIYIK